MSKHAQLETEILEHFAKERITNAGRTCVDHFGRRFIIKSEGKAGVVLDRAEKDWADVAQGHYSACMDLTVYWHDFQRDYDLI